MCRHRSVVVLVGMLLSLPSCTGVTQIDGKSDGMIFPLLRGNIDFSRGDTNTDRDRVVTGLELALSTGVDDFQPIGGGYERADFRLVDAHAAFIGGADLDDRVRIEGLAGLQVNHFEMSLGHSGKPSDRDVSNTLGVMLGAQIVGELVEDVVSVYMRGTKTQAFGDIDTENIEAGFKVDVSKSMRLLLAYRWWDYEDKGLRFGSREVELDLAMTGVVLGMEARF